MRQEENIKKAYALTAKVADDMQEEQPMEAASAFILMRGLAWVLELEEGEGMYEEMQEEYEQMVEEVNDDD